MKIQKQILLALLLVSSLTAISEECAGVADMEENLFPLSSTENKTFDSIETIDPSWKTNKTPSGKTSISVLGNYSSIFTGYKSSSSALAETRTPVATMTADFDLIIADLRKYFVSGTTEYNSIGHTHYGSYIQNPTTLLYEGQGAVIQNAVISDLHLYPGAYSQAAAIGYAAAANIIIDGLGDPNAKFIFSCPAAINFGAGVKITLINGAKACNVFWFGDAAAAAIGVGANVDMVGNCISSGGAMSVGIGANLDGRIFTKAGAMNFGPGILSVPTGTSFIKFRSLISFLGFTVAGATDNVTGPAGSVTTLSGDIFSPGAFTNFGFTAPYGGATASTFPVVSGLVKQPVGNLYQFNGPSLCSVPTFAQVAAICSGATLAALPTSSIDSTPFTGTWSPAMNNLATTTYTFTPAESTPCASPVTMTITVTPNVTPTFTQVNPIGYGGTLAALPTSSTNTTAITGTWSPALDNLLTTTYTFTPTAGICAPTTTMTITVGPSTTWNGAAWSNGLPTSTTGIIISGNYTPSVNLTAGSMTLKNNAVVAVPAGVNITLTSKLTVEAGSSFTLNQNANLLQTDDVVNTGTIIIKRDTNGLFFNDYTMWSSPVANQNLKLFSPLTDDGSGLVSSRFYTYDSGSNMYSLITYPATTNFAIGKGYLIRMPNNVPSESPTVVTGIFTGVPNNGNVNLTGLSPNRFYAIGNPYPSTISAAAFLAGNTTSGTLYFWRKKNAANGSGTAYATYTTSGGVATATSAAPDEKIAVGQGFIVKTASATALNFTNAMRFGYNNASLFKTTSPKVIEKNRIWLNMTNTKGSFSQALVGYIDGATEGVDSGIDGKYINDSKFALSSIIDNTEFTIQGRALPFDPSDSIPLSCKIDFAGDYSIAIDHFDGLFSGTQDIFLNDSTNGTETDLKAGAYTFSAAVGVDNSRFSLKFQKTLKVDANTFDENSVTVYKSKGIVYVNSARSIINNIKVFDIQGRLLSEQKNVNETTASIKELDSKEQVLIVQITSEENQVVNKKVVN